jgi:porphobilinogen synthase
MTALYPPFPLSRMQRLRHHAGLRALIRETQLSSNDLVYPLFIHHGAGIKTPIQSMPGCFQQSVDQLDSEIKEITDLKIPAILLFGLPEYKDEQGSSSWQDQGVVQQAIRKIKTLAPHLLIIVDLCFCEYTDHGHCGIMNEIDGHRDLDADATLPLLVKQALSLVRAGADVIAPSGMVDGMVSALRQGLDSEHFSHIPIMSYAVKYASALYGPFREATQGAPQFGNRQTYQMDCANANEALREAAVDVSEGADMLMVKPAHAYLDIIWRVKQTFPELPMAAYQVSGEYAMLKAAAEKGWLDEKRVMMEILTGIKRAGADIIITYYAKEAAKLLASS